LSIAREGGKYADRGESFKEYPMPACMTGGCACGAIRYQFTGEPLVCLKCHCRDCQRETGSGFAPILIVPAAAFTVTRGAPRSFDVIADNGTTATRAFCAECGSALFGGGTDTVNIRAGSLDDPAWFRPSMDIYTSRAQPWDLMNPELPKFSKLPTPQQSAASAEVRAAGSSTA
jgi:hypothetical protein